MTSDVLIKIAPIIGGVLLMLICAAVILRRPEVPNLFAGILVFAAVLFVIPALSIFNFKGLGIEFSGQATTDQVGRPAAEKKKSAEDQCVRADDPLEVVGRKVQVALDVRQRDVHDCDVEDHHELSNGQHDQGAPRTASH